MAAILLYATARGWRSGKIFSKSGWVYRNEQPRWFPWYVALWAGFAVFLIPLGLGVLT